MKKLITMGTVLTVMLFFAGCGSSGGSGVATGSGGEESGGGDSGTGTATVSSLSAVPSVDLETLDKSTTTSSNLAAPIAKSVSSKSWGEELREVGKVSRAGCEANMHKQEMIRMSQGIQISRCYPEAMEAGGLITIADGYRYYQLTPPEEEGGTTKVCEGIPEQDTERRAACESGEGGGKGGKEMKIRIGIVGGELHIDMCEAGSLMEEATYGANGSIYTITSIHSGNFAGATEKSRFDMSVDLGTEGSVDDGIVTLGSSGSASATGHMIGGFGSGLMHFEAIGSDSSNRVYGAFAGSFTDPYTQVATSFTGKVYSRFGGVAATKTGCAKYSFSGTMPPMRIQDMIPFGISDNDLGAFLQTFGSELGIQLTQSNYQNYLLCQNPDFNPEVVNNTVKPLKVINAGEACPTVTNTGLECFSITNISRTGDYGTRVSQSFTIIANSSTPDYYAEVNAYNVTALDSTVNTPAFVRNWDCTGTFEAVNFMAPTPAQGTAMQTKMQACRALEEKAFANEGMGGYDCGKEEQMNGVNSFADEGGGATSFGQYGGEYNFAQSTEGKENTCGNPGINGVPQRIGKLFANYINDQTYCFPDGTGRCQSFTVANNVGTPDDVIAIDSWEINHIDFYPATAVEVGITYDTQGAPCIQYYYMVKPTFDKPGEFGGSGGGTQPGEGGFIPDACKDASGNPVPENVCYEICSDPSANCRTGGGEMF